MARLKPRGRDQSKRFTSDSPRHKNGKFRRLHRGKSHYQKITERLKPAAAEQKAKEELENPLAAAFTASIEASRAFLRQKAETSLAAIHQDLVRQVTAGNNQFEEMVKMINKSSEGFRKPLDQDHLHFITKDGEMAGTQTLGDRMKKFKDVVSVEKEKVNDLGRQWAEVNQSITDLALEVAGPEGTGDLLRHLSGRFPQYAVPPDKSFEEEVEIKNDHFKNELTRMNNTMMIQMEACEEEMKDTRRKQMANLLSVMAAEI